MWDDVGCWCLRCRQLTVNGTDAVLQIDPGGDDLFVFYHGLTPCWDCLTKTVLIGGHNLFFALENYFRIVPVLLSCLRPCVSPMKYGIFYKHPY